MSSPIKYPLRPDRIRKVPSSFSWVDHRLIREGHLIRLQSEEILLYFFLVLVGDHQGLSYYSLPSICKYLKLSPEKIKSARTRLSERSLITYKAPLYQVLSVPEKTECPQAPKPTSPRGEATSVGEVLKEIMRRNPNEK